MGLLLFALALLSLCAHVSPASLSTAFSRAWRQAVQQSLFEQEVEDLNAVHKIDNHLSRRLIVMPLTDAFKSNQADAMYGKLQYGDKCSLPSSIGKLIFEKRYEVPWLFEIKPVRSLSPHASATLPIEVTHRELPAVEDCLQRGRLQKAYISPLDFRAPDNYIFLPQWLMNDLDLQPNDIVDVSFVRIKLADLVVLQPLSPAWDDLLSQHGDPKSLLEHEVNKYSSLTAGSTIYIEIQGKEYALHVKETRAEGGVAVSAVRVQDSDVRVDIDRSRLDQIKDSSDRRI